MAGGYGRVAAPTDLTLTILDDDSRPSSAFALAPASISESGGVATVTATLSHPLARAVTIAVSPTASTGAVDDDFSLSANRLLTVAAGQTTSADVVTVTAVSNETDSPDKQVTVRGWALQSRAANRPPDATLTLRDDDGLPTVSLGLSSSSIAENGGVAAVSAALGGPSSEAVTVTVAASGAAAGDFGLSGEKTLTIAANATASTGTVTITASDNDVDSPDKRVTVSGAATGGNGIAAPPDVTLTLADDEALPTATLVLSDTSISESGGIATVTATLSGTSSAAVTVTVRASATPVAVGGDFTLSDAATLTIAAGEMASAGVVTVTANDDDVDSPNQWVRVSGATAGGNGAANPPAATLTIADDEALPMAELMLSDSSISETSGVTTVTATLSGPSSAAVTVGAAAGTGAVAADFDLSAAKTLTIAAGATTSAGLVTVTANGNAVDSPNKSVTVSGTAAGGATGLPIHRT